MLDLNMQRLLEQAIDSPVKLQLLLLFCEHPRTQATATNIAERAYRDIWSTREALAELAEDGILCSTPANDEVIYRYGPRPEYVETIARLYCAYNEPMERDDVQRFVREAGSLASFRRAPMSTLVIERL